MKSTQFVGIEAMRALPTRMHRIAIRENMLGTVFAMNDTGEIKYFDYDHDAAKKFAFEGDTRARDPRVARHKGLGYGDFARDWQRPRRGQLVLYVLERKGKS
jgi:hypothetical protein